MHALTSCHRVEVDFLLMLEGVSVVSSLHQAHFHKFYNKHDFSKTLLSLMAWNNMSLITVMKMFAFELVYIITVIKKYVTFHLLQKI